ncbi:MAG: phosphoenolpyruvate carboxykinase (ATP) [Chloroflexi bacterium]|nr:phosphoenolpyruvate carboxykinase (ATP) [Chloroflexota bacterium]
MPILLEEITIENFIATFKKIVREKEAAGLVAIQSNPPDLLERAKQYGTQYRNGSWGWSSNIWSRSAAGSVVVESEQDLKIEHKQLMLRVLEHILSQGPLIQVDANLGQPGSKAEMRCRLYCDPQFPDIAYRWSQLNFPGNPHLEPDAQVFCIPHYLENPNVPGSHEMLKVIRFPNHNYTIVTCSSYQGECKKGFLSHWIFHVYKRGGTGEHAALREFTVRRNDGREKRIVMGVWGLTGSGKSTHGLYIVDECTALIFKKLFGVEVLSFVSHQVIKNDDVVGVFKDRVVSPEKGSWTKTEDVNENQVGIHRAAIASRALHENTEFAPDGNPSFAGALFQYHGKPNQNARTVIMLEDTGYFDGNVDSSGPLNMAVFISPGYNSDFAWLKLNDAAFACKVMADGRTTGHPAQSRRGVGEEKYESRYCLPFTMGVGNAAHVVRFYQFINEREGTDDPMEIYQISTTGRVGTKYEWIEVRLGDQKASVPKTLFEEKNGKKRPVGGTGPLIEETELFLFQAARGAVEYEPHPIWGDKVLVPAKVPGIARERLNELNPFSYHSLDEMKRLLKAQVLTSKFNLDQQCPGLPDYIRNAMDAGLES